MDSQATTTDTKSGDEAQDPRRRARARYWQGYTIAYIANELGVKAATVASWKRRDKWDETHPLERVEHAIEARLIQLVTKVDKSGGDFKEIDLLGRQMERAARVRKFNNGGNEADLNPKVANRNSGPRKKPTKNDYSEDQQQRLHEAFVDSLFDYQKVWHAAGLKERIRNLLKSRQIGATWYFAREALDDAMRTGRNQIFLSASKAQAHQFKSYILKFARNAADIELRGDPIILPNDAEIHFLGTNSRTAQSYHGNLYIDEYFWIQKFRELRNTASGMASHVHWRQTYFSTPSSLMHEAYPFWTGSMFNKGRPKDQRIDVDVSHAALAKGMRCADGQWRQIVTVEDALAGGCDLFDIEQLKIENAPAEFENKFHCMFIDDSMSVFPLAELARCMVDSWVVWDDFKPFAVRPLGYREVWIGYDPSHTGDNCGCIVVSPPAVPGGKFRVLEKHQWRGMDFAAQAAAIEKITESYNVTYIGIDATGIGQGVFQLVKQFFPCVTEITYNPAVKVRLVLKAKDIISKGRLEFDAGWTDLAQSFMAIRKNTTENGRQVTFDAGRSEETSHADLAWACMHALSNEPLEGQTAGNTNIMEIY